MDYKHWWNRQFSRANTWQKKLWPPSKYLKQVRLSPWVPLSTNSNKRSVLSRLFLSIHMNEHANCMFYKKPKAGQYTRLRIENVSHDDWQCRSKKVWCTCSIHKSDLIRYHPTGWMWAMKPKCNCSQSRLACKKTIVFDFMVWRGVSKLLWSKRWW